MELVRLASLRSQVTGHRSQISARHARGFTLIELLVSLGILTVITGQMLANFRTGQQASEVRFASEILVNQLRELQTNALSGRLANVCAGGAQHNGVCGQDKTPPITCPDGTCQQRIPTGYGIRFSADTPSEYLLFFDTNGNFVYDVGEGLRPAPYVSTGQAVLKSASAALPLDIVFSPPFAQVYVNGAPSGPSETEITIGHAVGEHERHVTVNRITGKIEHD